MTSDYLLEAFPAFSHFDLELLLLVERVFYLSVGLLALQLHGFYPFFELESPGVQSFESGALVVGIFDAFCVFVEDRAFVQPFSDLLVDPKLGVWSRQTDLLVVCLFRLLFGACPLERSFCCVLRRGFGHAVEVDELVRAVFAEVQFVSRVEVVAFFRVSDLSVYLGLVRCFEGQQSRPAFVDVYPCVLLRNSRVLDQLQVPRE